MRLYKNIKPSDYFKIEGKKEDVLKHVLSGTEFLHGEYIYAYTFTNKKGEMCVKAYNMTKHNRKVERKPDGNHILHKAYWEVWTYDIPIYMLDFFNLVIEQYDRDFYMYDRNESDFTKLF